MTKKLGSIKRIFGALAIGGALLFGIGAAAVPSAQAAQRSVVVIRQNNRWERERRHEWERREREHRRMMMHHRWQDRWGNWHWS